MNTDDIVFMDPDVQRQMSNADSLARIATALEQLVLEYMEAKHPPQSPQTAPAPQAQRPPAPPPFVTEPPPVGQYETKPPAVPNGGPIPFSSPVFIEGSVHASGHKPLKINKRGLYCPTKLTDGSWCQWRVTP